MNDAVATPSVVPERVIWMYWDRGLQNAPDLVKMCVESWIARNPTWQVIVLDERTAPQYADVRALIGPRYDELPVQKIAVLLRLTLLQRYGGVWADATLFCVKPLDAWLPEYWHSGFFAFRDPGPDRPLSNWFLAARRGNVIAREWSAITTAYFRDHELSNHHTRLERFAAKGLNKCLRVSQWSARLWLSRRVMHGFKIYPYYVSHYLFSKLVHDDERCGRIWEATKSFPALHLLELPRLETVKAGLERAKASIEQGDLPVFKLDWRIDTKSPFWIAVIEHLHRAASAAPQPAAVSGGSAPLDTEGDQYFTTEHLRGDLAARSFRGSVAILAGQAVMFLFGLLSTAVMARLLHPKDFGLVAMVTSITGFAGLFKNLGLSNATIQRSHITDAQVSFLFWVNLALSITVTLMVMLLAPVVAWFYHEPRLFAITCVLSLNFIFGGLTIQHSALLKRQMRFRALTVRNVVANACGIGIGIVFACAGFGYWSIVAALVSTNLFNCALVWTICRWRPSAFRLRVGARGMLAFGGNFAAFNILNYFTRNFDNVLIGRVLGSGPLGIYSKAYGLLMLPIAQVNQPMSSVFLAGLSRLQSNNREYADLFIKAVRGITLLTIPIVIFCFCFSKDIVLVLLGRKWLPVALIFQLLAPATLFGAISFVPGWLCQSLGRTRRQFHYALVSAPICVAGFVVGVRWGIAGVAVSFSITFSVLFCAYMWYASKDSPVRFFDIFVVFLAALIPALAAGSIVSCLRYLLTAQFGPFISLAIYGPLFIAIYVAGVLPTQENRVLILSGVSWLRKAMGALRLRNKLALSSTAQIP